MANPIYSPVKIGIYYDGSTLLHISNYFNYYHEIGRRIEIGGLSKYVKTKVAEEINVPEYLCILSNIEYFRGRLNANEASERGTQLYNDRVFDEILMAYGVRQNFLPLRPVNGKQEPKGIEILLSLTAYKQAVSSQLDVAVLFVTDACYVPLVRSLKEQGITVAVFNWDFVCTNENGVQITTKTSHDLIEECSFNLDLLNDLEEDKEKTGKIFVNTELRKKLPRTDTSEIMKLFDGHGFIKYPNNNLYFTAENVIGDFDELQPEMPVTFCIEQNEKRQQIATNVKKLDCYGSCKLS